MKSFFTFIIFIVAILKIIHWTYFFDHEELLRKQAENFCSCHRGLISAVYLEEYDTIHAGCEDGDGKLIFFGQRIVGCEKNVSTKE